MAKKKTDAQVVAHLKRHAPHILEAELDFDAIVTKVISADLGVVDCHLKQVTAKTKAQRRRK